MPTKVWPTGGDPGSHSATASSPSPTDPDNDVSTLGWDSALFTNYHKINLIITWTVDLEVTGAPGAPDFADADTIIEYNYGSGWNTVPGTSQSIGLTNETYDDTDTFIFQLPVTGDFNLNNVQVRCTADSSTSGTGPPASSAVAVSGQYIMVYLDSSFGGFQPV